MGSFRRLRRDRKVERVAGLDELAKAVRRKIEAEIARGDDNPLEHRPRQAGPRSRRFDLGPVDAHREEQRNVLGLRVVDLDDECVGHVARPAAAQQPGIEPLEQREGEIGPANIAQEATGERAGPVRRRRSQRDAALDLTDDPRPHQRRVAARLELAPLPEDDFGPIAGQRRKSPVPEDAIFEPAAAPVGTGLIEVAGGKAVGRGAFDAMLAPQQECAAAHPGERCIRKFRSGGLRAAPAVIFVELEHAGAPRPRREQDAPAQSITQARLMSRRRLPGPQASCRDGTERCDQAPATVT